jgi:uncharacterized membrane protein YdjX (TVP38/TMEM64 family)
MSTTNKRTFHPPLSPLQPAVTPSPTAIAAHHAVSPWAYPVEIAALVALFLPSRQVGAYVSEFAVWVNSLGVWGPLVFIAGYTLAAVVFVPGSLLTLAAGAIFGLGKGVLFVFIAAVLGSSAAFLVSRHLARAVIERKLAGNACFAAIDRAVSAQGARLSFCCVSRLSFLLTSLTLQKLGFELTDTDQ